MTITVTDYVSVADRIAELGCVVPSGIAVLPDNFAKAATRKDLLFGSEASTLRKLFKNNNFPINDLLPAGERVGAIHNKHFEWAPLLFISVGLISNDPNAITVALGIIANYATDFFKGMGSKKVKLSVVVEKKKDRTCKMISYEGDISGLSTLADAIRRISDE
jgi:hypothetical protein